MNELLLLSKEYISKDDFLNEINIKKYHFELGGLDDQLWLINDENDVCDVVINLLLKDSNGNIQEDEIDYHLYDGSDVQMLHIKDFYTQSNTRNQTLLKNFLAN